jgi:hypothetical protein
MLGKIGLNAEAQEVSQMEQLPIDVYSTKEKDGHIWIGLNN